MIQFTADSVNLCTQFEVINHNMYCLLPIQIVSNILSIIRHAVAEDHVKKDRLDWIRVGLELCISGFWFSTFHVPIFSYSKTLPYQNFENKLSPVTKQEKLKLMSFRFILVSTILAPILLLTYCTVSDFNSKESRWHIGWIVIMISASLLPVNALAVRFVLSCPVCLGILLNVVMHTDDIDGMISRIYASNASFVPIYLVELEIWKNWLGIQEALHRPLLHDGTGSYMTCLKEMYYLYMCDAFELDKEKWVEGVKHQNKGSSIWCHVTVMYYVFVLLFSILFSLY